MKTAVRALLLWAVAFAVASGRAQVIALDHGPNAPAQQAKHFVVLVSLQGFRWDYARKHGARVLPAIAAHGATAPEGMIPSYPSETWPNQYTLVTGLYPEHHGIVATSFRTQNPNKLFSTDDPASTTDGTWYSGVPLWVLAEQQGMRAACILWPGSEAAIQGVRPSFYVRSGGDMPDAARVDQALAWLKLPEARRPHFIAVSLSDVDRAGRRFGPESPQTRAAVKQADAQVGRLRAGLAALKLPVDLVVVSDQGMIETEGGWIDLAKYADLSRFETAGSLLYAHSDADAKRAYEQLKIADGNFKVYRRADVPRELHFNLNARAGDPVIVAAAPVAIRAGAPEPDQAPGRGSDGYDPRQFPQMLAIFYAEGPDVRAGVTLKLFENTNVYPFLAEILALEHPPVDGSANVLRSALKSGTPAP